VDVGLARTSNSASRCALLTHAGFECKSSDNGAAGRVLIEEFAPAVAIVDIGLPGIDGFELARRGALPRSIQSFT